MAGMIVTNNNVKKMKEKTKQMTKERGEETMKVVRLAKSISNSSLKNKNNSGSGRKSTSSNGSNTSVNKNKPRTKLPMGGLSMAFRNLKIPRSPSPVELIAMKINNKNTKKRQDLVMKITSKLTRGIRNLSKNERGRRSRVKKKLLNGVENKKLYTRDLDLMNKMNVNSLVNALEQEFSNNNKPVIIPEDKGSAKKPTRY